MSHTESDKLRLDPGPASTSSLSLTLEDIPAAQSSPEKKALPVIDTTAALEAFPAVQKKIQAMWASGECDQFLHSLFMDTRGGTRRGFPMDAADEIMFLVKFNKTVRAMPLKDQMNVSFAEAFRIIDQADQKRLTAGVSDVWGATGVVGEGQARPARSTATGAASSRNRAMKKSGKLMNILPWIILAGVVALAYKLLHPVFTSAGPTIGG